MITGFRFAHPEFFALLLLLGALLFWGLRYFRWRNWLEARLKQTPIGKQAYAQSSRKRIYLKYGLLMGAFLLLVIALARPQTPGKVLKQSRKGVDIMIALDVSRSMLVQDVLPSRLARAKKWIQKLIAHLEYDRVGLILFSSRAYLQTPPTPDYASFLMLLDLAHPELFAGQSTSIKKCLALAFRAMRASKTQKKLLLLVSDGEDHDAQALDLAQEAAQKGFVIYTIGVGTRSGGPIPLLNALGEIGDWKRDEKKRLIYSKLNPALLQAIASATNGRYFELTKGAEAINAILKTKDSLDKKQFEQTKYVEYIEWSPAFIGLALALCFLELLVPPHRQFAPLRQASQDIRALCQRWVRFFKE